MNDTDKLTAVEYAQMVMDSCQRSHGRKVVDVRIDERQPLWAAAWFDNGTEATFTGEIAYQIIWKVRRESKLEPPPPNSNLTG